MEATDDVCDISKAAVCISLDKEMDKINENRFENDHKDYQQKICLEQSHVLNDSLPIKLSKNNAIIPNKSFDTDSSAYLIRSALAKSILRKNDSKNTLQTSSKMQMVSVLKKPPPQSPNTLPLLKSNSDENIVTSTTNCLNDKVENIILQDIKDSSSDEQAKKPSFRKKLNLAEYRNRREQNRDNSRTNSPIQPTLLVYVHHASTTTEPIKNDSEEPIWFEREIGSILKPKSDIDEEKNKSKPLMCDIGIQTYETVFEFSGKSLVDTAEKNNTR